MKKKAVEKEVAKNCDCVKPELIERIYTATDGHLFTFCKSCKRERVVKITYFENGEMRII